MNKQINPFAKKQIDAIEAFCATKQPLVAIKCVTYNHEKYLQDALEGFVQQKTTFPFVAIVHDDASTDRTASILKEYAEKYPDIIFPIYETENQHSKFDGSLLRITTGALNATRAKYIAICEGDDYWTDPLKLQKQVDFLESHPEYSMVFANVKYLYENGSTDIPLNLETREYAPIELYEAYISPTPTILFRSSIFHSNVYHKFSQIKRPVFGDLTLFMACGVEGKIYGMEDVVCCYRRLSAGASFYLKRVPYLHFKNRIAISNYLGKDFKEIDRQKFVCYFLLTIKHFWRAFPSHTKFMFRLFWFAPLDCLNEIAKSPKIIYKKLMLLVRNKQ